MDDFVCSQLETNDLSKYISVFRENEIDKAAFMQLTPMDVGRLFENKIGPMRKLLKVIETLRDTADVNDRVTEWTSRVQELNNSPDCIVPAKVLVYIDNSNVFINTQQHAAKLQKFSYGIKSDKRRRIDIGKLLDCIVEGRDRLGATLYGSEPPMIDSVWKAIREKQVVVKTHKKSTWTKREKQIDAALIADAVDDINKFSHLLELGTVLTVIVVSGDRDMLEVIKKALKNGWRVEVWSYEAALASDMRKLEKENHDVMRIMRMDEQFANITFGVSEWKKTFVPPERSLVLNLEYHIKSDEVKNRIIQDIVKRSTEILHMPMIAKVLPHTAAGIANNSGGEVSTQNRFAPLGGSGARAGEEKVHTPVVLICYERVRPPPPNGFMDANGTDTRPKYDFNKHVWSHRDALQKAVARCVGIVTYPTYCQKQGVSPECDDLIVEDDVDDDDPDSIDVDYNVVTKKEKPNSRKYSGPCPFRFRCKYGTKCPHGHTDQQKEFFKEHPNAKRSYYKTKLCRNGPKCKYSSRTYLCMFAHNLPECYCPFCAQIGNHWPDECPEKPCKF